MHRSMFSQLAIRSLLALACTMGLTIEGLSREKYETIDANAQGTSTQLGAEHQ